MDLEDYYLQGCRGDATVSDIRPTNYRDDTQSANAWEFSRALYASNFIFAGLYIAHSHLDFMIVMMITFGGVSRPAPAHRALRALY